GQRHLAGALALALVTAACGATRTNNLDRASGTTTSSLPSTTTTTETTTVAPAPPTAAPGPPRTAPPRHSSAPAPAAPAPSGGGGPNLAAVNVRLTRIATLQRPLGMAVRNGDPTIYVAQKTGQVVAFRNGVATAGSD